jgi:hypothetical protein
MFVVTWNGARARDAARTHQRTPSPPPTPTQASAERTLAILRDHDRPEGYTSAELAALVGVSITMINYTLSTADGVSVAGVRTRPRGSGRHPHTYRVQKGTP